MMKIDHINGETVIAIFGDVDGSDIDVIETITEISDYPLPKVKEAPDRRFQPKKRDKFKLIKK